jgi:hypothetical protein
MRVKALFLLDGLRQLEELQRVTLDLCLLVRDDLVEFLILSLNVSEFSLLVVGFLLEALELQPLLLVVLEPLLKHLNLLMLHYLN